MPSWTYFKWLSESNFNYDAFTLLTLQDKHLNQYLGPSVEINYGKGTKHTDTEEFKMRGNFIYITQGHWHGKGQPSIYITPLICKAAYILNCIWKPRLQWHYKHTLKTRNFFPFFFFLCIFFSFWYKMVQTTIQNICAVDSLQKSHFNFITVQWLCIFFCFCFRCFVFPLESMWI